MSKQLERIGVVAFSTMVSRVLGLVRDMLTAAVFGTTALASAFFTAFTLPNLFRRLLGEGALTAAFVPTLNEELTARKREGAFVLVSQVASWLLVITVVIVVLATSLLLASSWWGGLALRAGIADETVARWMLGARYAVWLFPYMVFVCLAAVFSAALQTLERFLEPALSPIWLNLAMIGSLGGAAYLGWADSGDTRVQWLCGGVLVGGFFQMAVPAWTLVREGWRPRLELRWSPQVRAIAKLMGPTILGSAIYLINIAVVRLVGLSLNDEAVSLLNLATRLMELPIGVFAIAVSTVVFPLISKYASQGDHAQLAHTYRQGMRLILVVNIPAAVGLVVLSEPIIRLLFQRGAFRATDTALMAPVLAMFALGLPFFSFVNLALRAFYARKDTKTPVHAALLSFVVNLGLSLVLMRWLSTVGLALASNVAVVAQAWYLQAHLTRRDRLLAFHHLWKDLLKIAAGSALMGIAVWFAARGLSGVLPQTRWSDGVMLGALIPVGVAMYGGVLWLLRIEGRDQLLAMAARFAGKFGIRSGPRRA